MSGYQVSPLPQIVTIYIADSSASPSTYFGWDSSGFDGWSGEVLHAVVNISEAVTGDNTDHIGLWLCKGTVAAPELIAMINFVTGVDATAFVTLTMTLSGDTTSATTLDGAIVTTDGTTVTVVSGAEPMPVKTGLIFPIKVDDEIMLVTAGAGTETYTVTRGWAGTTAATHLNGADVTVSFPTRDSTDTTINTNLVEGDLLHAFVSSSGNPSTTTGIVIQVTILNQNVPS